VRFKGDSQKGSGIAAQGEEEEEGKEQHEGDDLDLNVIAALQEDGNCHRDAQATDAPSQTGHESSSS
jgi:hypothetical protein